MVLQVRDRPAEEYTTQLRRVRRDALPEEIDYRDDGCDIHARCLTCPLPRCRYDEPGGVRAMLNAYRDRQILALRSEGAPVDQIAERYGLSRRTVFRIVSGGPRSENGNPNHECKEESYA